MLAAQNPPVTLVLDDLNLLTDPKVLDGLNYVLRNVGPGLRLVVASRMDPLLPLHRYRLAGELTEIRASDLAFSVAEAGLLMAQHGITLPAGSLECLTRRTEGWAAGLRLAATSMDTHPNPDQFLKELAAEDSALTGYLVEEVLNTQPPEVREILLSTSILEHVSGEAASELTGNEQAAGILPTLAHANAFVQPAGPGRYRYHTLFAEVLRLKLRREYPDRMAPLHRHAARWYERSGLLTDAVRHATQAGDWQLAASIVIDGLAIGEIIEPRGSPSLASEFGGMPRGRAWTVPQPHLVSAAVALSSGRHDSSAAALDVAEGILARLPADQEAASRLAAAIIRLTASLRTGISRPPRPPPPVPRCWPAGSRAESSPGTRKSGPAYCPAAELSSCGQVISTRQPGSSSRGWPPRPLRSERTNEPAASAISRWWRSCVAGLRHAVRLADQATAALPADEPGPPGPHLNPAALVALAWVHLEHDELREAHSRLKQADTALGVNPDKLIEAVAHLAAAYGALAERSAAVAAQIVARARSGWSVPAWLEQRLSLAESRAYVAAGDIQAALTAAGRAGRDDSPEVAVMLAHAQAAAGDRHQARHALAPALAASSDVPERVRLQAWLVDARLGYDSGDPARGRSSLVSALRLAEPEQLRLPFVLERGWIEPVLRSDPALARTHRSLFSPILRHDQLQAPPGAREQAPILVVEPLTEREREVLRHVSGMLNTDEIADEMYITVNTVKTHLKNINRKLAVAGRSEAVRRARQLELI